MCIWSIHHIDRLHDTQIATFTPGEGTVYLPGIYTTLTQSSKFTNRHNNTLGRYTVCTWVYIILTQSLHHTLTIEECILYVTGVYTVFTQSRQPQ